MRQELSALNPKKILCPLRQFAKKKIRRLTAGDQSKASWIIWPLANQGNQHRIPRSFVARDASIVWMPVRPQWSVMKAFPSRWQLHFLHDLGMKSYRVNTLSDAQRLGELIALAKARDIEILPVITPSIDLNHYTGSELYTKAYDFPFALISKFKNASGNPVMSWKLRDH
jgi:hypothetical protein